MAKSKLYSTFPVKGKTENIMLQENKPAFGAAIIEHLPALDRPSLTKMRSLHTQPLKNKLFMPVKVEVGSGRVWLEGRPTTCLCRLHGDPEAGPEQILTVPRKV